MRMRDVGILKLLDAIDMADSNGELPEKMFAREEIAAIKRIEMGYLLKAAKGGILNAKGKAYLTEMICTMLEKL